MINQNISCHFPTFWWNKFIDIQILIDPRGVSADSWCPYSWSTYQTSWNNKYEECIIAGIDRFSIKGCNWVWMWMLKSQLCRKNTHYLKSWNLKYAISKIPLPVDVAVSKDTTGWLYFFTKEGIKGLKVIRKKFNKQQTCRWGPVWSPWKTGFML